MKMPATRTLSPHFISQLIQDKTPVIIFLNNGIKLNGILVDETDECYFLKNILLQRLYKPAVATVQM